MNNKKDRRYNNPRDLGRDGITRMVNRDRALRARGIHGEEAEQQRSVLPEESVVPSLLARIRGQSGPAQSSKDPA